MQRAPHLLLLPFDLLREHLEALSALLQVCRPLKLPFLSMQYKTRLHNLPRRYVSVPHNSQLPTLEIRYLPKVLPSSVRISLCCSRAGQR